MTNVGLQQSTPVEKLRAIIKERMIRHRDLAERAGIPASSLSNILAGRRELTPHYAALFASALKEPVDTFLPATIDDTEQEGA